MKQITKHTFASIEHKICTNNDTSNFQLAFYFLPKAKRFAISTIYVFCSYLDDIVDDPVETLETKRQRLDFWRDNINRVYRNATYNDLPFFKKIIEKYVIPKEYFLALIDGIGKDLQQNKYNSEDELLSYCYGVASVVGLICLYIFSDNEVTFEMEQYAINLGYTLQLINIIRDVHVDAERGYCYIPQEDLDKYGYNFEEISSKRYNDNYKSLMERQYNRAIEYYDKSNIYLAQIDRRLFKSAEMMKSIYYAILQKIKRAEYDVFSCNIRLSKYEKLRIILNIN